MEAVYSPYPPSPQPGGWTQEQLKQIRLNTPARVDQYVSRFLKEGGLAVEKFKEEYKGYPPLASDNKFINEWDPANLFEIGFRAAVEAEGKGVKSLQDLENYASFGKLLERNVWSSVAYAYVSHGKLERACEIDNTLSDGRVFYERASFLSSVLEYYVKNGKLVEACNFFESYISKEKVTCTPGPFRDLWTQSTKRRIEEI